MTKTLTEAATKNALDDTAKELKEASKPKGPMKEKIVGNDLGAKREQDHYVAEEHQGDHHVQGAVGGSHRAQGTDQGREGQGGNTADMEEIWGLSSIARPKLNHSPSSPPGQVGSHKPAADHNWRIQPSH